MPDDALHAKYEVTRKDDAEGKHRECWFFVLDPLHDRVAFFAMLRYAELSIQRGDRELGEAMLANLAEVNKQHDYHESR